jgi:hypothetical protein
VTLDRCATAAAPITEMPEFIEAVTRLRAQMHAEMRAVEAAEVTHQAFLRFCGEDWRFALGWNEDKVLWRLLEIYRFAMFNSEAVIPFDQRRRIARLAHEFLAELNKPNKLGGLPEGFRDTLQALAGPKAKRRTASQTQSNRGGDRRSGERTLRGGVLGTIVRLYCEAHEEPAFSDGGPLVRFANSAGRWALGVEGDPFTSDAVKAEFRKMKPKARRGSSLRILYKPM